MLENDTISECTKNDLIYLGCVTHHPYEQVVVVEHHPLGNQRYEENVDNFKKWLKNNCPIGWSMRVAVVGGVRVLINVEHLRLGDRVKFLPTSTMIDKVIKLHYRNSELFGGMVTVTHDTGCWSKQLGEKVELMERTL